MNNTITDIEIIKLRDHMSLEKLRSITNDCKKKFGFIDFRHIFITMGYEPAYGNKYYVPNTTNF